MDVLNALLAEADLDRIIVTTEMQDISPSRLHVVQNQAGNRPVDVIDHRAFKALAENANGVIKTADTCPYANLIIVSG
jgi:D-ribose pyranase